jgi:hypothetical protein
MANEQARMQPTRATRLIFEYEGDEVRLVAQQDVEMVVPAATANAAATAVEAPAPGYYLDARDASGQTLARVAAQDAFARSTEVFPENHKERITRVDVAQPRGAFTVTMPASDAADHVTLVRVTGGEGPAELAERAAAVVDVATFPLSKR